MGAHIPEGNWASISGFPAYLVSDEGLVWSITSGRVLVGVLSRDGYRKVHLSGNSGAKIKFVHRLVAEAFVEGEGEQVLHFDGDKSNNSARNLSWGSCRQNIMDKWRHGRMPHGNEHHAAKIPESEIPWIRASQLSNAQIAKLYGVSRSAIYNIRKGKSYGWL